MQTAHLSFGTSCSVHITSILNALPICFWVLFMLVVLAFKTFYDLGAEYLKDCLSLHEVTCHLQTSQQCRLLFLLNMSDSLQQQPLLQCGVSENVRITSILLSFGKPWKTEQYRIVRVVITIIFSPFVLVLCSMDRLCYSKCFLIHVVSHFGISPLWEKHVPVIKINADDLASSLSLLSSLKPKDKPCRQPYYI